MRTKNSLRNMIVSLALGFIAIIINFIAQKFFVDTLGVEYLGLNGLFTNIIAMLSVVELGLGVAVVYHLYKPLQENDEEKISSIMMFYKKGYRIIAFIVLCLGLIVLPFLPHIVGQNSLTVSIPLVYMLFLLNVVVSYLFSFKRLILYADQKNYLINIVHIIAIVVLNALQIWVLIATRDYYLYLILKVLMTLIENMVINAIVDRKYKLHENAVLDQETRSDIFIKIKGLIYHRLGEFLVLGSTNIIISILLGIKIVGLYSNYFLIQTALTMMFSQMSTALTASVGNLLLSKNKLEHYKAFRRLYFINQVLAVISVAIFIVASNSFIIWWLGEGFTFSFGIVAALALNIYLMLVRSVFGNFKQAAGIFYEDRYVPLIESAINIVASIALIQFMGLAGAFIGTALSSMALHCYSYPKFVYKGIFGRGYREYAGLVLRNLIVAVFTVSAAYFAAHAITFGSQLLQLVSDVTIAVFIPAIILWIIYRKSEEYTYFIDLIAKILRKTRSGKKQVERK